MKSLASTSIAVFIVLNLSSCSVEPPVASEEMEYEVPSSIRSSAALSSSNYFHIDPFADIVVENGVNDQGQCCQDPSGILGNWFLLDPSAPAGVALGDLGFVVVDMGEGEEIVDDKGFDFMAIEFDPTLLGGGSGASEAFTVSVSNSPTGPFVEIGTALGPGVFDLAGSGLSQARYVRIDDAGSFIFFGADMHAVVAFNFAGADFQLAPHTIKRSGEEKRLIGRVRPREGFDISEASIVLVAGIGQPSPNPFIPFDIKGRLTSDRHTLRFDKREFLDAAIDGSNIVVGLKLTSITGEVLYLFDMVNVVP